MALLVNEILINAPIEKIWEALSNLEELEKYDPSVKKSNGISQNKTCIGAARRVDMQDGKNWFEETCTIWEPNVTLAYELTACSFPVRKLKHTYSFEYFGSQIIVKQVMQYQIKFGFLGKILDKLIIKKKSENGIRKFFAGLKLYTESK